MPSAKDANFTNWENFMILYDDSEYSVVWGKYDGADEYSLGERWNKGGETDLGFPNIFGKPIWHVIPEIFTDAILLEIERLLIRGKLSNGDLMDSNELAKYRKNLKTALGRF
ncbi:MAG: hypothetical protein HQK91_02860 [Nitrospirae bacterium]|nr:hypothetical protein [Nitrospirota bacterium]